MLKPSTNNEHGKDQ